MFECMGQQMCVAYLNVLQLTQGCPQLLRTIQYSVPFSTPQPATDTIWFACTRHALSVSVVIKLMNHWKDMQISWGGRGGGRGSYYSHFKLLCNKQKWFAFSAVVFIRKKKSKQSKCSNNPYSPYRTSSQSSPLRKSTLMNI